MYAQKMQIDVGAIFREIKSDFITEGYINRSTTILV